MSAARKRVSVQKRSDLLRDRVRDAVEQMGLGNTEYGYCQFSKKCVEVAERFNMRTWKDKSGHKDPATLPRYSLNNLLGIRFNSTGNCEHWVLDIFEKVVEEHFHGVKRTLAAVPDPMIEAVEGVQENVGVQVVAEKTRLAPRILSAYLARDADAMLELLGELEERENPS